MAAKWGVLGAGAVGLWIGGRLLAQHPTLQVELVGRREALVEAVKQRGLLVTDYTGFSAKLLPERVSFSTDARRLADCDVVLVAVKLGAAENVASVLADVLRESPKQPVVVSLQNGVRGAALLRAQLPHLAVLGCVVEMNCAFLEDTHVHRGTEGGLVIEKDPSQTRAHEAVVRLMAQCFPTRAAANFEALQWTKLVVNINNCVNALSGQPLVRQLSDHDYRLIVAALMEEATGILARAGVKLVPLSPVLRPNVMPHILRMPNAVYLLLAQRALRIDPHAVSSMAQDLARGNETEIDFLNGEIVRLATALKAEVPLNRAVVDLVHRVEAERKGSPRLSAQQIADAIGLDLAAHRARARGRALLFALAVFALALLFFRALRR